MKNILIALDYDASAEQVAKTGFEMAKALNAKVTLLHVIDYPIYYSLPFNMLGYKSPDDARFDYGIEAMRSNARKFLRMIVAQLSSENVKITVAEGEASGTILAVAQKEKASLVIMGSHRMKGLNKLLFSDTAARVLKHSKLPLLTIPTNN